ncbi:MAG: AgmX/PglI C-terminal domain-containing protein [Proteobacteria bacterium]|nr:AgmX/PglI C-terminal domain-containing protein [Pseudomonadota bacterium]
MAFELRFQIPGQLPRTVPMDQSRMMIGTLPSNHVVLRAPGVDPIHALVEESEPGRWLVTDVGSETGIKVNGVLIDVEAPLKIGDKISVGSLILEFAEQTQFVPPPPIPAIVGSPETQTPPAIPSIKPPTETVKLSHVPTNPPADKGASRGTVRSESIPEQNERRVPKQVLFSPRDARPSGDILEVVAYWGDSVLDVDLFHPQYKDYDSVSIGVTPVAHFISAGEEHFLKHTLAKFSSSGGYKLKLLKGMDTRIRRGGKVERIEGEGSVSLDRRDIAHIKFGSVRYFLLFVRPPEIDLGRSGPKDPVLVWLTIAAMALYFLIVPALWMSNPPKNKDDDQEIFAYAEVPQEQKKPEPEKKPPPEPKKPEVKVEEKKEPPKTPKPPPPPKPKPVAPVKPVEKEKVEQPKPVEKPVEKPQPNQTLQAKPTPPTPQAKPQEAKPAEPKKNNLSSLSKATAGMESTGAKKPDFKYAGEKSNKPLGAAGGPKGAGNNQTGGAIKGNQSHSVQGVEGVNNNKASGVNLDKLGLGVGKVLNKTGPGAIMSNFQSASGGAGGGAGSGAKTYGMGGAGSGKSLGLAGAGGAANNFGSGSGGDGSGQGGSGGFGGSGGGPGFGSGSGNGKGGAGGHGRANVTIPPGDPSVSGGLTAQEIMAVIRAHLNEIRHCYEQLLQRSPSASGKLAVNFTVALSGNVSAVNVSESTLNDSVMRGCVTGHIQRWDFPKPRGGQPVTVNYPFVFNPL